MTITKTTYPTPKELIEYLKQPGRKKARKSFANSQGGRCCLGHYADMCGMSYDPEQAVFRNADEDKRMSGARLPGGHWLFSDSLAADGTVQRLEHSLTHANDNTSGFAAAIEILEGISETTPVDFAEVRGTK